MGKIFKDLRKGTTQEAKKKRKNQIILDLLSGRLSGDRQSNKNTAANILLLHSKPTGSNRRVQGNSFEAFSVTKM